MDWAGFADWALKALIAGGLAYGVGQLSGMRKSMESLNNKMTTMVERTGWHQKALDDHSSRLKTLEMIVAKLDAWLGRKRK